MRQCRVYGVEVALLMFATRSRSGSRVPRGRGRRVPLGYRTLTVIGGGRCGRRCACRVGCGRGVGSRLYLGGTGLLLENRVVTQALSFALLAVPAHGVGFVALSGRWLAHEQVSSDVGARCRKFARNRRSCICSPQRRCCEAKCCSPLNSSVAAQPVASDTREVGLEEFGFLARLSKRQAIAPLTSRRVCTAFH